jgi:MFS family permease
MKGSNFDMSHFRTLRDHPFYVFRDFRKLYIARFVSGLGDKVFVISLAWWLITNGHDHGELHLGLMMALTFLPVVLFGPFFGPFVDRINRKTCMIVADAVRCALFAGLGLAFFLDYTPLPLIYTLCFLAAAFIPLFEAASSSSLLQLTSERHLASASAFDTSVIELSSIAGALCVSVLLVQFGQTGIFLFNAVTFLLSLVLIAGIGANLSAAPGSADPADKRESSYASQLRSGFSFTLANKAIFSLLALFALLNFFVSPILIFIPLVVKDLLHQDIAWVARLELAMSAGSLLAFLLFSMLKRFRRIYSMYFIVIGIMSLSLAGLGVLKETGALMGCVFVFGGGLAIVNGMSMILFQHGVPDEMKGRFFSILKTVCFAVIPVTLVLNGYFAAALSVAGTIVANGAASLLLSFLVLIIPRIAEEIE